MDFKDILNKFDKASKEESIVETTPKRPANMLTESTEVETVEVVEGIQVPSLKNMFEELSLEPAKPGAQTIHKDGEVIGTVSNPSVANQMSQAIDKGELQIGQEMQEAEQLDELAPLAALGPALMTGVRVAGPWLAKRGAQMMSAVGKGVGNYAKKNPIKTAVGTGVAGTEQGREFAGNVKDGAVAAVDGVNATFGAANDMIDSGKHMFDQGSAKIAELGDGAGGMIRNAIGDAAFDTVKRTASTYGLPLLGAVALLYGGKKVLDKVMDKDEDTVKEAKDWISGAIKDPGAFSAKAKRHGMTTKAFANHVLANKDDFPAKTEKQANLAKTLGKMKEGEMPPQGPGQASPLTFEGAQNPPDDGSHNSSNDEKGNAAANAALAANDADTPQLVKEKAKGKVSKSSKLPSISKVKSMCNEGFTTQQIQQLHPKCNQQELNIMIKNTKQNLKEGADHILKAAKHMGHAHGLCKGSYACPHDAGSEGAKAYHEGYKRGLDEACGMGIKNEPIAGMEEGVLGGVGGAIAGSKLGGMAGTAIGGSIGGVPGATIGKAAGAALGGIAGDKLTGDGIFEEPADEVVDTMASYGAMGEAESSPDGDVGADDDGAYDKYDWDAQTVARKGIDEDDVEEGNAFTGALAKADKGEKFSVGDKTFTKTSEAATLEEDEWTFESLEKELNSHLVESREEANKEQLDEGYTMSITQGEMNQPDRVSVNATDAEADKLIKFVKDVGLGNYGDAEVLDAPGEVADVSFYGSPDQSEQPMSSHDDMLKLMGIVDVDGDYEDEVEAPGVVVDVDEESCDECGGGHSMEEGCGDKAYEDQGYNDREDEQLGMKDGKESSKKQSYADRRDDSRGDFGHRHGGHLEEKQGYDDKEDESLGMRTGKESDKKQSMKDRRDDSYGKFGKRDEEHRDVSLEEQEKDAGIYDKYDWDASTVAKKGIDEESDAERDDHAERAGKEVARHAKYDGRKHPGRDGEDIVKDLEYDDWKDRTHESDDLSRTAPSAGDLMDEGQGYDDKEDESLGMRTGKESSKKQSMKDRRDDSYGKFGKRDSEHRDVSLEEQEKDAGLYDKYDWDASTTAKKGIDEESDAERDDHAERAGKEVARHAKYDGRKHPGRDGEDIVKDLEYDDWKDKHHMEEDQGYDDKEDESLGMKDGKESDKKQSMKDRRDERYGKFGKRDEEHREKSLEETLSQLDELAQLDEKQGYDDEEDESLGMRKGKESDKKQSMKDRRDDSYGKFGKRDKEDRHVSLEENLRTLDLLAEVGAETSEEPTQPLSQHDDERLLTKEGAEDAPKDSINDGENEEITEMQTDDQREFKVAEGEDKPDFADIDDDGDKEESMKKASKDKKEKVDEWANDAGKNGTETSFEQDIDFMTKVISGGINKQKSTGQTTIPVIAGQEDRMGYNGADVVKEGSVLSSNGFATILNKLDSLK